ncbi:sacsin N-terminal ATP-binding-like domain-containing protein [Aquimarina longa]|uniref:sacsin N-terminal ATP-binding-like domain-containing protein n=1 Tax=Aquimarina longa TaxID=1080221 RepID=UPI0007851C69|nr:hypothetical protein [Aquimarina longa]
MIEKEQIQKRRQEIAEIRHADSVYRDIVARENERADYEKRWFWELLQNAKDSVNPDQSIKVKICIEENEISFLHTGNPFELDDILSLIIQGSSKNNKEGMTGRFGTGFMTTYLLSKEVRITGKLVNNQGCFDFLLNRNATDNEHFYLLQQESNKQFDNSIRNNNYLGDDEFQTKFTYKLGTEGKKTASIGLKCLDELIPITQLFNKQLESVTVIEDGITRTFNKSLVNKHEIGSINEWMVNTLYNGKMQTSLKAYVQNDHRFDACIITTYQNETETILPLTKNHPRLYYTFPLLGTEEIGIPIIINSTHFDPRVERDGIYLKKVSEGGSEVINKEIINKALSQSLLAFVQLFKDKNISGIHEVFNFKLSKDLKWMDHDWFVNLKNNTFQILATKQVIKYNNSEEGFTSLNDLTIPFTDKTDCIKGLWELLSKILKLKVPLVNELQSWVEVARSYSFIEPKIENIDELDFVWGIDELIDFVEQTNDIETLNSLISIEGQLWLNNFYSIIVQIKRHFPLEKCIALNRRNNLRKAEGISWDLCNDETLIVISDLVGLNFADKLFSKNIQTFNLSGVENFSLQEAVSELKSKLNQITPSEISSSSYQICNAKFLKWLISKENQETIKDLKVLRGTVNNNNEDFIYDHFPKSEHLLLGPKKLFEKEFPIYASLVRDKDCMNDIYTEFLSSEDFSFLNEGGFIHYSPIIIKTENATIKLLEDLMISERDLNSLRDSDGNLKYKFQVTYSDFAYLTTSDGHIYARNTTQKSSLERLRFLLNEAIEKDVFFDKDYQEIKIDDVETAIQLKKCLWVYRAKRLNWINIKTESEDSETKFVSETPSSKNLSELFKENDALLKTIRGARQQTFLNKLGVGVSDLIRNTLPTDELRLSWDKAITNMITSDADPELVQEIFNDPSIRKEYERRLGERKLISRNQFIGKLIEDLFKEYITQLKAEGVNINIERKPFGSDYILTEESSDLINQQNEREAFKINNWLVELKATGKDYAAMTPLQAKTATEQKENYALIVVPLNGFEPDLEYLRQNIKVIHNIGYKIDNVFADFSEIEIKKSHLHNGQNGISVSIEDQNIRFRVNASIWNNEHISIKTFIETFFVDSNN